MCHIWHVPCQPPPGQAVFQSACLFLEALVAIAAKKIKANYKQPFSSDLKSLTPKATQNECKKYSIAEILDHTKYKFKLENICRNLLC